MLRKKSSNGNNHPPHRLSFVTTEDFHLRVKVEAARRKKTISEFCEAAIREAMKLRAEVK